MSKRDDKLSAMRARTVSAMDLRRGFTTAWNRVCDGVDRVLDMRL